MKFNPNCIRDILLSLVNIIDSEILLIIDSSNYQDLCYKYSSDEFLYHLSECIKNDLLRGSGRESYVIILKITSEGYSFLRSTSNDEDWDKIKKIAVNTKGLSLDTLKKIVITYVNNNVIN